MMIHNRGKFHQYSICGFQVENFQSFSYQFSIHEMALFGFFWKPLLPQILSDFAEMFTKWSIKIEKNSVIEIF